MLLRARAHPRSRGENQWQPRGPLAPPGSSPLTRGKQLRRLWGLKSSGLIPAHAGKTFGLLCVSRLAWAHPRSRGENCAAHSSGPVGMGSSPLTRGKRAPHQRERLFLGLIPAHAGKTQLSPLRPLPDRAHPRSRGENAGMRQPARPRSGSSPLTRGKLLHVVRAVLTDGLIPAHAGKTSGGRSRPEPRGAHPRSRGENPGFIPLATSCRGSSPLTRGKPDAP